jgi:5-methylcytosine-specific restriction endonuclease McrA
VEVVSFARFPSAQGDSLAIDRFDSWIDAHDEQLDEVWEKMTDEIFHLLFGNRAFLLKFNLALAEYLRAENIRPSAEYLNEHGYIKRAFMPKWVRDAVFFRDHGRCVFCHADLSGLLSLDQVDHFDHIVPLARGGVNDPTNIQLLCGPCNLQKSASEARTGLRYPAWWSE